MPLGFDSISESPVSGTTAYLHAVSCAGKASRMMNGQISTQRKIRSQSTTTGGLKSRWLDHITSCCAALQIQAVSESATGMRPEVAETRLTMYTPSGADIRTEDRVVPLNGIYEGQEFAVESGQADDAGHGAYGRWSLRRLEKGGHR